MGVRHRAGECTLAATGAGEMPYPPLVCGVDFVGDGAEAGEINWRGYADQPATSFWAGVCALPRLTASMSTKVVLFGHLVGGGVVRAWKS